MIDKGERAGPLGTGQRRPSRSPRSQRSRSADVDCLKKYTERRVEERRHTEIPDASKLDPSKWVPLPKNITRIQPALKKAQQSSRDEEKRRSVSSETEESIADSTTDMATPKKLSPTKEEETTKGAEEKKNDTSSPASYRQTAGRSHSADVSHLKKEKLVEERRHTECSDPRTIATRWLPQINTSRFRYDASPFARISNSCEITKNAATRWMTFVKNPSPCPIPRMNTERKPSATEACHATDGSQLKSVKSESPKWEPLRKFAPMASKTSAESSPRQDKSDSSRDSPTTKRSPDANEQSKRLTQRMRDLYDFKTENEWPKRAINARRGNTWISKSSSEEERTSLSARRNSQDLEFNDRMNVIKLKDTKVQSDHQEPKRPRTPKKDGPHPSTSSDIYNSEYEERLRKFNERLRYSEDLGLAKPKIKERRTYSDDYDEKARRASTRSNTGSSVRSTRTDSIRLTRAEGSIRSVRSTRSEDSPRSRFQAEKKRPSDASTKSRASYAEVSPVTPTKKESRPSDASYVSVANYSAKRASVDCKSSRQMVELPPRRAFSQTEERPATPVPPIEWNDDRYAAARLKQTSERQKRDSTRYKVYLT
ncbi:muscle M-line assembly protein unc-89-like [Bombus pyrosoma]|uniref:muscle M-line assembly protein unc-89-like n=1 Tax=Bombus pyrosoma TaxID=396416 RepID=UPI001CB9A07C|nr:muscle M-line assembly protein unc-89-like [Bombus pyrosoma]